MPRFIETEDKLNIVGTLSRSDLTEYQKKADYAQLSSVDKVQMFYRRWKIEYIDDTIEIWEYLSFANIWMGASDSMT